LKRSLTLLLAGNVLGTALRPIGAPLEKGVTGPLGNALGGTTKPALGPLMGHEEEKSEYLGGKNVDSYDKPEKVCYTNALGWLARRERREGWEGEKEGRR
jgi:hypothetical protein